MHTEQNTNDDTTNRNAQAESTVQVAASETATYNAAAETTTTKTTTASTSTTLVEADSISRRYSGILVHPTSFPSRYGIGDLGQGAYDFIDFLKKAGQTLWQCLPLGPTGFGDSPYQSFSSFAGQPILISPDKLLEEELLSPEDLMDIPEFDDTKVDYGPAINWKMGILKKSYEHFKGSNDCELLAAYAIFCKKNSFWLDDYALFMTLKAMHNGQSWEDWEEDYKFLSKADRKILLTSHADEIGYVKYTQFMFYRQWMALKIYANEQDILIIGDIPIFVAPDSADIWANQKLFQLDSKGYPTAVAGVPPDYFSKTGQLWGNPLYNWEAHQKSRFSWWIARIKHQLELVDYLRIDHFRGFDAYWSVPYGDETALGGEWINAPGKALFTAITHALGDELPIVAEDLGVITKEVEELRDAFHLPGMKVLQFAFNKPDKESPFLPHQFKNNNCICYTGTHDNDTTRGWWENSTPEVQHKVRRYLNCDGSIIAWDFIRLALSTSARYAIFPLQDLFGLDNSARMNVPGAPSGNWSWRYDPALLTDETAAALKELTVLFGRFGNTLDKKEAPNV